MSKTSVILRKFDEMFIKDSNSNNHWSEGVHAESYQEQRNGSQKLPYPPSLHSSFQKRGVELMLELDRVINLYQRGTISLFEAARTLDVHPSEFTALMVEKNQVTPMLIHQ